MSHKRNKKDKWLILAAAIIPPVIIGALYVIARRFPPLTTSMFSTALGDAANWLQALVATWSVAVTAVAAIQIVLLRKQTLIQEKLAETEAYRPLISPQMQSIKRFIASKEFGAELNSLDTTLKVGNNLGNDELQNILEKFRADVYKCAAKIELPLLGRQACLDDVEALINEYNYICKQILDKTLRPEFATEMSAANLRRIYIRLGPFLHLRRKISPQYAKHFTGHAESNDDA